MLTSKGVRCDPCGRIAAKKDKDTFMNFMMPKNGKFPGVGREGNPDIPVTLHACPPCRKKVQAMIENSDISRLPRGPLRIILETIKSRGRLYLPPDRSRIIH